MDSPYAIAGILAALSSFGVGVFVLFRSSNRKVGWIWFFFALSVAVYGFVGATGIATAKSEQQSLLRVRWSYALGVLWIATLFHHFVSIFLEKKNVFSIRINYLISLAFLSILPTHLVFVAAPWRFNSIYFPLGGICFPLLFAWWITLVFYSHYQLVAEYKNVSEKKKKQIKYFFLATAIGFSGGGSAYFGNFGIDIYPWGSFTICLYPLIMAYAIVRHELLDIHFVIQKTVKYIAVMLCVIAGYVVFVSHFTHRRVLPLANFSILTGVLSFLMAGFVFSRAPKRKITILWALVCLAIASWSLGFGMMSRSLDFDESLFWQKWFMYAGSILVPVLYLHFVSLLVNVKIHRILKASYLGAFLFEIANISNRLATSSAKSPFVFYTEAIFPAYHLFFLFFLVLACYAHVLLFRRLETAEGALRNQIQYVFAGTAIGFLGGCMTFPLSFNIHIFPIGTYLVVFYLVAITYAIYKHHLMDVNLVLRKSLVYSLMTGVLTAVYLVFITQGAHVLQNIFGASTLFTSVIAACVITTGFLPLRSKIQTFVDRYFFRDWSERGEMVREVAAGFSHELKSPLAGLSMQAQMTLAQLEEIEKNPQSLQEALPRIKEELHYMVNKAMDAARRIEAVRGVAEPTNGQAEPVDICAVLDASLVVLNSLLKDSHVNIHRALPENLSPVRGNGKQLEIVFINLIKNALEAMEQGNDVIAHTLSLSGFEQEGSVVISVKDTGAGITPKELNRIFEPHFTTKGRRGTGMGLFLSQQIVKAHGGSIEVKSEEGKGADFNVRLPKYAESVAA